MIGGFFNFLINSVFDFLNGLLGIFPNMPIDTSDLQTMLNTDMTETVLSWVNYFLPLDVASATLALWATGMMAYVSIKLALKYTGEIV